jgi:hypothetical protein
MQFSSQLGVVCSFQAGLVRAQQPLPSYLLCPSQVLADIQNAYFPSSAWNTMMCIAWHESSYNVNAEDNDSNGTTDYGLFQINRFVHHCCFPFQRGPTVDNVSRVLLAATGARVPTRSPTDVVFPAVSCRAPAAMV